MAGRKVPDAGTFNLKPYQRGDMLSDALRYPFEGEDAIGILLIGGLLLFAAGVIYLLGFLLSIVFVGIFLLPFALVPILFVQGYLVAVIRATVQGHDEPPKFDDWKRLGLDGLKFLAIGLVYSIPVVVLSLVWAIVVTLGVLASDSAGGVTHLGDALGAVFTGSTIVFVLVVVGYTLVLAYLLPAAICNFAREEDLAAAFDLDLLKRVTLTAEYAVPWLLGYVVILVINNVAGILVFLLVGFPILFYAQVVGFRLYTVGYVDALGLDISLRELEA